MISRNEIQKLLIACAASASLFFGTGQIALTQSEQDHTISLVRDGIASTYITRATTIAALLAEHNIELHEADRISAPGDSPIVDGMTVTYQESEPYTIISGKVRNRVVVAAQNVRDVLRAAHITIRKTDTVSPGLSSRPNPYASIRIVHAKVVQPDLPFRFANFGSAASIAGLAVRMVATAYTPQCNGCSGITKMGMRAGHGVVAVDPRFIPLGTRLYIPGYGRAIAGDTGGSIVGHRIDLGFVRNAEAMQFGRRAITVYVLSKK